MLSHNIIIQCFIQKKTLYESAWSPYSLIMDCFKFLSISEKVHYVMTIQKILQKFIKCDYNIYNILVLNSLPA
jgi:hypothetical protein